MAYIPPHKRQSCKSSAADSLPCSFNSLSFSGGSGSYRHRRDSRPEARCIPRWWTTPPLSDTVPFRLEPFACEFIAQKDGRKPLAIALSGKEVEKEVMPWVDIAERVLPELLIGAKEVGEMERDPDVKLSAVARLGKVLFHE